MLTHYNWYTHVTGYYDLVLLDTWGSAVKGKIHGRDVGPAQTPEKEAEIFGVNRDRISLITLPLFTGTGCSH